MYQIRYTPLALEQLMNVPSDDDRNAIVRLISELTRDPYQTRALKYESAPYRRARAAGGKYRIFFWINEDNTTIGIEFIGIRVPGGEQDAYATFRGFLAEN